MQYRYDHLCKRANGHPTTERYVFIRKAILTATALCATFGTALGLQALGTPTAQAAIVSDSGSNATCNPAAMPITSGATTCQQQFVKFFKEYGTTTYEGSDQYIIDQGYLICEGWPNGASTEVIYHTMLKQGWTENEADMMIYGAHNYLCWNVTAF